MLHPKSYFFLWDSSCLITSPHCWHQKYITVQIVAVDSIFEQRKMASHVKKRILLSLTFWSFNTVLFHVDEGDGCTGTLIIHAQHSADDLVCLVGPQRPVDDDTRGVFQVRASDGVRVPPQAADEDHRVFATRIIVLVKNASYLARVSRCCFKIDDVCVFEACAKEAKEIVLHVITEQKGRCARTLFHQNL